MRQPAAVLLAHAWRNDQFGQFFANSFLSTKTKHALGGRVKFEDSTICVHGNDAIERGIENAAIQHFELIARDRFAVFGPLVWISSGARRLARD
jgi:hypothetical protein